MLHDKNIFATICVLSFAAVLVALLSQHLFDMAPCAWCVFQRVIYLAIGIVSGLAALHHPNHIITIRVYAMLTAGLAVAGVASALVVS